MNPWEWYLIEPEIIKGTIEAARELSLEKELKRLNCYASLRGILGTSWASGLEPASRQVTRPGTPVHWTKSCTQTFDLFTVQGTGARFGGADTGTTFDLLELPSTSHTSGFGLVPSLTGLEERYSEEALSRSCSRSLRKRAELKSAKPTKIIQGNLDAARAINEVLAFWTQLAGSPELQTGKAFRGAKEPHLSECPVIAWRMALIRAHVFDSKSYLITPAMPTVSGQKWGWGLHSPNLWEMTGGLRARPAETEMVASYAPFRNSPFSDALSKIEEAHYREWEEKVRSAIERDSETSRQYGSEYNHFFDELPPILSIVFPRARDGRSKAWRN